MTGRGLLSDKSIKELEAIWKRGIKSDIDYATEMATRIADVTLAVNEIDNIKTLRVYFPEIVLGGHDRSPGVRFHLTYHLPECVPEVPDHVRREFFRCASLIDVSFPVHKVTIGFKTDHFSADGVVEPKDDRGHIAVHDCPSAMVFATYRKFG